MLIYCIIDIMHISADHFSSLLVLLRPLRLILVPAQCGLTFDMSVKYTSSAYNLTNLVILHLWPLFPWSALFCQVTLSPMWVRSQFPFYSACSFHMLMINHWFKSLSCPVYSGESAGEITGAGTASQCLQLLTDKNM